MRSTVRWLLLGFILIGSVGAQADEKIIGTFCSSAGAYYCATSGIDDPATHKYCTSSDPVNAIIEGANSLSYGLSWSSWESNGSGEADYRRKRSGITRYHDFYRWRETGGYPPRHGNGARVMEYNCLACTSPFEWNDEEKECITHCPSGQSFDYESWSCTSYPGEELPPEQMCSAKKVGNPIDVTTGEKVQHFEPDIVLGQGHFPIVFNRLYRSMPSKSTRNEIRWRKVKDKTRWNKQYLYDVNTKSSKALYAGANKETAPPPLGNMRHSFEVSLKFTSAYTAFYQDSQGELIRFSGSESTFKASLGTVTRQADGSAILVKKNAVRETFNSDGQLIRIEHPQGGWQTLVYDDLGRIDAINHYQGYRLQFHYDPEHKRLVRLSTRGGDDVQFRFDDKGQLTGTQLGSQGWETYRYKTIDITNFANGNAVTQIYRLEAIIDASGVEYASWEYDHQGLAIESRHAGGAEKVTIDYQGVGSLVTNALGHQKTVINDPHGRVVEVIGGSASSEQLSSGALPNTTVNYSSNSIDIIDEQGIPHQKSVNSKTGQIKSVDRTYRMEGDRRFTYKTFYNWNAQFPALLELEWQRYRWDKKSTYDEQGRLTQFERLAYGSPTRTTTYAYNEQGLLASVDGPRTDVDDITEIKYDDRSRLSEVWVGGVLQQKVLAYDAYGRISEWQDGNGATYQQQYSHDGQLTQLRLFSADGSVDRTTVYDYDARGLLEKVTQADGAWVQYGYDDARRLTSVSDALGNRIDLTVDLAGNIEQTDVRDVNGTLQRQHKAVYDQLSRLSQSIEPDTHAGDETKYDALGNAIAYTNALGTQSQSEFDALGRLSKYIDANNGETRYTYNAEDQITSVTDPEGKKTEYKYNYFGDLEKIISPDTGTTTFAYDQAGNRTQSKNANNEITTYQYDAQNRLIKTTYHDSSTVEYRYDLSSSANSVGRLSEVKDRQGHVTTYHYNAAGEVVKRVLSQGDSSSSNTANTNTEWHYAANGQLQAMVYPSGAQLKPTYNNAGQITALTWQANGAAPQQTLVSEVNYQAFSGAINALAYGNGLSLQRDYALDGQITGSRLLSTSAIDPLRQREYTLDAINRITSIKQDGDWGSQQHGFDYDLLSRLTQAKQHGQQDDYSYDGIGNRLSHDNQGGDQPGNTTYGYASNSHQLDSIQGVNAQTVVINALGQTTQLGERQFRYDPTGHISTLTTSEGITEYRYFPNQLRSQKIQGDQVTYYDYDLQGQLISERVSQNGGTAVTTREYLWLGNELLGYYTDGQLFFVHNDHLATPQAISDSQQNKVWSVQQKAFGESTLSDHQITFNIRFPGQYYDNESGLHYNWHRYYDTQLGRYLQSDPIGLNGGLSTFGYVYQNPISNFDPDGLWTITFDFYPGIGGGLTLGWSPGNGIIAQGRLGIGAGGGFTIDPLDEGPYGRDLYDSPYGGTCPARTEKPGISLGGDVFFGVDAAGFGPRATATGGRHFLDGTSGRYSEGPSFDFGVNPANAQPRFSIGGYAAVEVTFW